MEKRDGAGRALLRPEELSRFCKRWHSRPPEVLRPHVEVAWAMEWDLPAEKQFRQVTLPNPCVQLVVEPREAMVMGVVRKAFAVTLEKSGFVLGVKFRPAGFAPFAGRPVAAMTDLRFRLSEYFGRVNEDALLRMARERDAAGLASELFRMLEAEHVALDEESAAMRDAAQMAAEDSGIKTTADLAERCGRTVRALQRGFQAHVGVGPKWVIRRYRLQEAAARIDAGKTCDWAGLARELGYFDQAHFANEFRRFVGCAPGEYERGNLGVRPHR